MPEVFDPEAFTQSLEKIYTDVTGERVRQIERGYSLAHDASHSPRDMVKFANWRFTRPLDDSKRHLWFGRKAFIEAIAVLVAAVQAMDHQTEVRRARGEKVE